MRKKKISKVEKAFDVMIASGHASGLAAIDALHDVGKRAMFYTEAAQKLALKRYKAGFAYAVTSTDKRKVETLIYTFPSNKLIAIFPLENCYKLRKPTKGISKKVLALLKGKK